MAEVIIPAGLKIWLFFLLVLVLLGYPVTASVFFGAIAGLAGGFLVGWWQSAGPPPEPVVPKAVQAVPSRRYGPRWQFPVPGWLRRSEKRYQLPQRRKKARRNP